MRVRNDQVKQKHPRSVDAFCERHGFCRATFYNQAKHGKMPDVLKIGARTVITEEAEDDWKRRMTAPMHAARKPEFTVTR